MKKEIYRLMFDQEQTYWWYAGRRKIILEQLEVILEKIGPTGQWRPRILDYGCGTGLNLVSFQKFGDVFGMEPSESAMQFCCERGLKQVVQVDPEAGLDGGNPFGKPFNIVTILDVLEHIPDDAGALKKISRLLKPGGIVLVTVPAFEFLWSGEDYVSNHLRRYRKSGLARVFRAAGLEVEKLSYFNTFLFPAQVAVVLWDRIFRPRRMYQTNLRKVSDFVNSLLISILSREAKVLRKMNFPIGWSLLCWGSVAKHD